MDVFCAVVGDWRCAREGPAATPSRYERESLALRSLGFRSDVLLYKSLIESMVCSTRHVAFCSVLEPGFSSTNTMVDMSFEREKLDSPNRLIRLDVVHSHSCL